MFELSFEQTCYDAYPGLAALLVFVKLLYKENLGKNYLCSSAALLETYSAFCCFVICVSLC